MEVGFGRLGRSTHEQECRRASANIAGKDVEYGIGTHSNSQIVFDLPGKVTRSSKPGRASTTAAAIREILPALGFGVYADGAHPIQRFSPL